MKKLCLTLGSVGALLSCFPVMYRIHLGDAFNPASYFLWSILSLVCAVVLIRAGSDGVWMIIAYVVADATVGVYAYMKAGTMTFGPLEFMTAVLTTLCAIVFVWCDIRGNLRPSVIMNACACMAASIPLVVDCYRTPHLMNYWICVMYFTIPMLSFIGASTFNGRVIPVQSMILWAFLTGLILWRR